MPNSVAIEAIPVSCFSVAWRAPTCCCCTSRTDLKTLVTPTCGVSATPTCGVSGFRDTPTCGVPRPVVCVADTPACGVSATGERPSDTPACGVSRAGPAGPDTSGRGVAGAAAADPDTPGSGVSAPGGSASDTPRSGVSVSACGVRKIRIVLWYFLRSTCTSPVARNSASVRDTTLSLVSSSPASVRCLMPISSTSSPRVHARPNVHSERYQSFSRCDPSLTRRARRMNVSGCSGAEASECGSRGCGFVYASAGAVPVGRSAEGLVFDPGVGVD